MRRTLVKAARDLAVRINSRSYMTTGSYLVRLDRVEAKPTYKLGPVLLAEFTILESTDLLEHPIGARRVWVQKIEGWGPPLPRSLVQLSHFIHDEAAIEVLRDLPGQTRRIECANVITRTGKSFTRVDWQPEGDATWPGVVAANRKIASDRARSEAAREAFITEVPRRIAELERAGVLVPEIPAEISAMPELDWRGRPVRKTHG